jgi:hypothetical protein
MDYIFTDIPEFSLDENADDLYTVHSANGRLTIFANR